MGEGKVGVEYSPSQGYAMDSVRVLTLPFPGTTGLTRAERPTCSSHYTNVTASATPEKSAQKQLSVTINTSIVKAELHIAMVIGPHNRAPHSWFSTCLNKMRYHKQGESAMSQR